jgi:N-terminal domain of toast_rack, DUF2154/LiaI-LiaF-like transmembrane region
MAEYRRSSIVGAAILIGLGTLFLYTNSHPSVDPWPLLARYWPLLLIFIGAGKLWDYYAQQQHPGQNRRLVTGGEIAAILLILLFVAAVSRHHGSAQALHQHLRIDYGNAQTATVNIEMPEGGLNISGGASELLEGDADYNQSLGAPKFSYSVDGSEGQLVINQESGSHTHFAPGFGGEKNDWDFHLGDKIPLQLKIAIGAGHGNLRLGDLPLTKLDLQVGAGSVVADLRGNWKNNLDAHIQGGVGSATIRLPKNVGVEVSAHSGLGSIDAHGMQKDGDNYVNQAYGKSPVTLELHVDGGVGSVDLIPEM